MNRPVTWLMQGLALLVGGAGVMSPTWAARSSAPRPYSLRERAWYAQAALDRVVEGADLDVHFLAAAVFFETNRRRVEAGRRRLRYDPAAMEAAERQATMMANLGQVGHGNPLRGEETVAARLEQSGVTPARVAENVASTSLFDFPPERSFVIRHLGNQRVLIDGETGLPLARRTYRELATVMVDQWLASPGHRENLMSRQVSVLGCGMRFARVATGLELVHAVQVFLDP
ncbi:MAG: CAP domain-containing protein [Opitutaceae bacterium]